MIVLKILAGIVVLILLCIACFIVIGPIEFIIIRFSESEIGEKICKWIKRIAIGIFAIYGTVILGIIVYGIGEQVIQWLGW